MKKILSVRGLLLFVLIVAALLVKYIYLHTAESAVDIEEIPLVPLKALAHGAGRVDIADTRLYNFNYITNYVFLRIFGLNIGALKLTSLAFFAVACFALFQVARPWFRERDNARRYVPLVLFAFGPPVAQMWSLKNRGGFIETIALFAVLTWIYQRWIKQPRKIDHLYAMGVLSGIAIWAQPISLVFILPILTGIVWETARDNGKNSIPAAVRFGLACTAGVMPLIALNFLYNFNTFRVLAGGEGGQGAVTPLSRLARIFADGFPRLFGLKQQWSSSWVLGTWPSIALLVVLLLIFTLALFVVLKRFFETRVFDETIVLGAALGLILLGNIWSSWGSFQEEPRRLLLVYIPLVLLVAKGLADRRGVLLVFCALWLGVSAYANVAYVRANPHGFNSPFYRSYKDIATFLVAHDIRHAYVSVWEGSKISFESGMRVTWSATPYMPSGSGFHADGSFGFHDAAVFYMQQPGASDALKRMDADLAIAGIECVTGKQGSFVAIYACSKSFNIDRLPRMAKQVRQFQSEGVIFDASTYINGAFEDVYAREPSMVWTRPMVELPVRVPVKEGDHLCIVAGAQRRVAREDVHVMFAGEQLPMEVVYSEKGEIALYSTAVRQYESAGKISIAVSPFLPAKFGSGDSRSLGIPLRTIRFVQAKDDCR